MPHPFDFPWAYTVDFEEPGSAILGGWQRGPGSNFFSTRVGNNGVWRQPSTNGTPYAFTSVTPKTNHAIQAEITLRTFSGTDRWVGLATGWTGESNHYHVALRTSGRVEINRLQNGVSTTLASAPAMLRIGTKVRLRLESIRSTHRVYLNDRLVLTARDSALPEGNVALITNRAAADYDNLVASPSPFATIYADDFTSATNPAWTAQGAWQRSGGLLRQTSNTTGYSRLFVGALTEDQYVQARVRPLTFTEPDNWVGLMLSYQDERNHAYLSLRGRGVISLWRRTDGVIDQLGTRAISVTPGTWYTLRVEKINLDTRVFVNDVLQFSVEGELAPVSPNTDLWPLGRVGLITHKATAEFDDFLAYQP